MSLGEDIAAALPGLRSEANSMMLTTGRVTRVVGRVEDPVTRELVDNVVTIYMGMGRFKAANTQAGRSAVPGAVVVDQSATLSLPIGAPGAGDVRLDDIWEAVYNPLDPTLVGKRVRVTGVHSQTFATAHRYPVEEIL